ncbi:uncharacterized protein L201_005191 [Kwoniella dendrophila CBS 6074]|uniref:Uncharacterized protein n=1 Tax=Kwoniella dendrophila CBS 6074 TaxID=1295534 RepID=A0AAX4JZI7_9TREE
MSSVQSSYRNPGHVIYSGLGEPVKDFEDNRVSLSNHQQQTLNRVYNPIIVNSHRRVEKLSSSRMEQASIASSMTNRREFLQSKLEAFSHHYDSRNENDTRYISLRDEFQEISFQETKAKNRLKNTNNDVKVEEYKLKRYKEDYYNLISGFPIVRRRDDTQMTEFDPDWESYCDSVHEITKRLGHQLRETVDDDSLSEDGEANHAGINSWISEHPASPSDYEQAITSKISSDCDDDLSQVAKIYSSIIGSSLDEDTYSDGCSNISPASATSVEPISLGSHTENLRTISDNSHSEASSSNNQTYT